MSAQLYDVIDLMVKCTPDDFHNFDVRITRGAGGEPGWGTEVVVYDKRTGEDVSEPLIDIFAKALVTRLHEIYPDTKCTLHAPYERGKRQRWSILADCDCTLVFESRLRAAIDVVERNRISHRATGGTR